MRRKPSKTPEETARELLLAVEKVDEKRKELSGVKTDRFNTGSVSFALNSMIHDLNRSRKAIGGDSEEERALCLGLMNGWMKFPAAAAA